MHVEVERVDAPLGAAGGYIGALDAVEGDVGGGEEGECGGGVGGGAVADGGGVGVEDDAGGGEVDSEELVDEFFFEPDLRRFVGGAVVLG